MAFDKNLNKLSKLLTAIDDDGVPEASKPPRLNGQVMMQLEDINNLFDGVATKEEIAKIVKSLTAEVSAITQELRTTGDTNRGELEGELKNLRDDLELFIEQIKIFAEDNDLSQSELTQARATLEANYASLAEQYAQMREEMDEMDTEKVVRSIVSESEARLRTELAHKTPTQIRDELLSLPQTDRFPAQMISNWDDIEKEWSRVISLAATAQIEVLQGGTKVLSSHRMNFGNNFTITNSGGTINVEYSGVGSGDMLGANNLSEVVDDATARTNLGLGDSATKNVGTAAGTVAAGDHTHAGYAAALGADDNYVTDAEKVKLSNLSGTNTGDQDLSLYVAKATYDAHTILAATSDNTPAALIVSEQSVVGRATGGNIAAIAIDSDLSSVSASDDTIPSAKATKAALDAKAPIASPTFTGTLTVPVGLTGVLRADTGVVSVDTDVTDIVAAGTSTAAGKLELATDAETVTGTDTARATTPANITARLAAPSAIGSTTPSTGKFTSVETTGAIELGAASDTTVSRSAAGVIAVEGVVIPSISSTNTLTNKRVTKRTGTTTSHATPTINTDNVDFFSITAQTEAITSMTTNLSGTPTEGQTLWIAITGTDARAITWGASFEASTVALPTTTVTTNRLDVGFIWNTVTSKWRCVASA